MNVFKGDLKLALAELLQAFPLLEGMKDPTDLVSLKATNPEGEYLLNHLFLHNIGAKPLLEQNSSSIKELAFMVDCSRNAIPTVETLKQLTRILSLLGYNVLMLYLEDVFEVNDEPYFGYLRGRYSKQELKDIVSYASIFGIEVVPCIQTLAHYNQLVRWYEHLNVIDIADILLVGSPRMQLLLDNIFRTLRECFTSRRINVGMDEAYLIGRGKYYDQNRHLDRFSIMKEQLDFVASLCQKHDFKPMMWSDMFFKLAFDNYYDTKGSLPTNIIELVKGRFDLVYWDYYHVDVEHYKTMMDIHLALDTNIYFAGGAWKWSGFTPDNRFSIQTMKAGMQACKEKQIPLFIVTAWGDNGAESSLFSILPALLYTALLRYDLVDEKNLNSAMNIISGGFSFDDYMLVDSANRGFIKDRLDQTNTTNKSLLFNDPLLGVMDSLATFIDVENYKKTLSKLEDAKYQNKIYSYVFSTQRALLRVLTHKADLGLRLRKAYKTDDRVVLISILAELPLIIDNLGAFMDAFTLQWHKENKPHGFDVQDLRLGGLKQRLIATKNKLEAFLNKKDTEIPELNEEILDYMCQGREFTFDTRNCEYRLHRISSVNVND